MTPGRRLAQMNLRRGLTISAIAALAMSYGTFGAVGQWSSMVAKFRPSGGSELHGPPYNKAEEAEFHRRVGRGPIAMYRADGRKEQKPHQHSRRKKSPTPTAQANEGR
jgi:hypothetical protein